MLDKGDLGSWTPEDAERWWQTNLPENAVPEQGYAQTAQLSSRDATL
jgi:hypothetical protein